jgi:hypothetical protein
VKFKKLFESLYDLTHEILDYHGYVPVERADLYRKSWLNSPARDLNHAALHADLTGSGWRHDKKASEHQTGDRFQTHVYSDGKRFLRLDHEVANPGTPTAYNIGSVARII